MEISSNFDYNCIYNLQKEILKSHLPPSGDRSTNFTPPLESSSEKEKKITQKDKKDVLR